MSSLVSDLNLNQLTGETILAKRASSFSVDKRIVNSLSIVYLNLSTIGWTEWIACDGINTIKKLNNDPTIFIWDNEYEQLIFAPSIDILNEVIEIVSEYSWQGLSDEKCGFLIQFKSKKLLSIFEKEDELVLSSSSHQDSNIYLTDLA